ncbi:hypothetical protein LJC57_00985 [Parabacteroides sp. OttesenSCG-928-G07]|nr:hypothetical protein [Parabacteroides sp. OttesenSCG-928-G07]
MHGINITFEKEESVSPIKDGVCKLLCDNGFNPISDTFYICHDDGLLNIFRVIQALKENVSFKDYIRDIHAFKMKDFSSFTDIIKE